MAKRVDFNKTEYDAYRAKGLSNTQIAFKLGMSEGTLYAKLKQCRDEPSQSVVATPSITLDDEYALLYKNRIEVNAMLRANHTKYYIASKYNVSVNSVDVFISKRKKFTPKQMHEMRTLLRSGQTEEQIAAQYDTTPQIVSALFKTNICQPAAPSQSASTHKTPIDMLLSITQQLCTVNDMLKGLDEYYNECSARLDTLNKKIQDVLHIIEFGEYDEANASTVIKSLAEYRKERRELKNFMELAEPLLSYISGANGYSVSVMFNDISSVCAKIQTRAKMLSNRVYKLKGGDNND